MSRRLLVVLGWMAATAAAIGVALAGVSVVAGGVIDPLPATLGAGTATEGPTGTAPTASAAPTPSPTPTTAPPTATVRPSPTTVPSPPPGAASEVRSYALVGGTATLRFEPGRVTVLSAVPTQGFSAAVEGDGTDEIRVEFDSDDHRSRLRGWWEDGPRQRIDEDDDGGDHDRGDDGGDED